MDTERCLQEPEGVSVVVFGYGVDTEWRVWIRSGAYKKYGRELWGKFKVCVGENRGRETELEVPERALGKIRDLRWKNRGGETCKDQRVFR